MGVNQGRETSVNTKVWRQRTRLMWGSARSPVGRDLGAWELGEEAGGREGKRSVRWYPNSQLGELGELSHRIAQTESTGGDCSV